MRARGAAAGSSRCYTITCGRDGGEPRHPRSPALPSREHRHPRSRAIALPRRAPASPDPGCSLAGGVGGVGCAGKPALPVRVCLTPRGAPASPAITLPGRQHPRLSPSPGGTAPPAPRLLSSRGAGIPGYHPHRGGGHRTPAPRLLRSRGAGIPGYHPAGEHRLFPRHGAPAPLAPGCLPPHPPAGRLGGGRRHRHPRSRAIPSWGRGGGHRHSRCPAVPPRGSHRFPPPPSRGPVPGSAVPGARVPGPVSAAAVVGPVRGGWRTSGGAAGAARGGLL